MDGIAGQFVLCRELSEEFFLWFFFPEDSVLPSIFFGVFLVQIQENTWLRRCHHFISVATDIG